MLFIACVPTFTCVLFDCKTYLEFNMAWGTGISRKANLCVVKYTINLQKWAPINSNSINVLLLASNSIQFEAALCQDKVDDHKLLFICLVIYIRLVTVLLTVLNQAPIRQPFMFIFTKFLPGMPNKLSTWSLLSRDHGNFYRTLI